MKVNKFTKNSNGTISINYTMKSKFKTYLGYNAYQSLSFSYSMHSALKLKEVKKVVNPKKGTHTLVLPAPSPNYLGTQTIHIKYGAGGHSVQKRVGIVYNVPSNMRGL